MGIITAKSPHLHKPRRLAPRENSLKCSCPSQGFCSERAGQAAPWQHLQHQPKERVAGKPARGTLRGIFPCNGGEHRGQSHHDAPSMFRADLGRGLGSELGAHRQCLRPPWQHLPHLPLLPGQAAHCPEAVTQSPVGIGNILKHLTATMHHFLSSSSFITSSNNNIHFK